MKFNINLFRDDVKRFDDCLRPQTKKRQYDEIGKGQASGTDFRIYLMSRQAKAPPWVEYIKNHVSPSALDGVENVIHAAIILLEVQTSAGKRFFGVTHGHGHHLVDKDRIELNFGLKTALNAVDPDQLNLMDARNVEVQTRQKRVASSASATLGGLDFEFDTEILRIVGGQCADKTLGLRIEGADSVQVTVKDLEFGDLGQKCHSLYDVYRKDTYKTRFEFIDHLSVAGDAAVIAALESKLTQALSVEQQDAKIALVCPDQIDQRRCVSYKLFGLCASEPVHGELSLATVYDYLRASTNGTGLAQDCLKKVRLLGFDEDGKECTANEPLLAYLVFETTHQGKRYVLSNEKWYQVHDAESRA